MHLRGRAWRLIWRLTAAAGGGWPMLYSMTWRGNSAHTDG